MQVSLFRRLEDDIEHAVLVSLEVSAGRRQARLRLAVLADGRPGTPRGERTLVLHGVSRVAARLWQAEPRDASMWAPPDGYPAEPGGYRDERVGDLQELNDWLRLWSGCRLAGQPGDVFDVPGVPPWLDRASLDVMSPEDPGDVHSLDLQVGDGVSAGGRMLDLRIEFDDLELIPSAPQPDAGQRGRPVSQAGPVRQQERRRRRQQQQQQQHGRRRVSARVRRRRVVAATAVISAVALVGLLASWLTGGPGKHPGAATAAARHAAKALSLPAAEAGLMPWHLAAPISRETAVAGPTGQLVIFGGLTTGGKSANGIYAVRPASGASRLIGVLKAPVHDAATAMLGSGAVIFGGGSPATVATVQAVSLHGQAGGSPTAGATLAGSLPARRSDAAAVTIGGTAYVVGGYNGQAPDAPVLATSNGRSFATVAKLPVPVRYPAVAALRGQIYVFGGQAITGPHAGAPVNVIQAVNPARHTAAVIGTLPEPLAGAAAVTLGGEVFVAGGQSSVTQHITPGLGTTQLTPSAATSPSATSTVSTIWAFDPVTKRLLPAGRLQVPVSHAAVAVTGNTAWIVGGESGGALVSSVQMLRPNRAFGTAGAPGAGSPYFGYRLLIADRGNDRLLLLNPSMQVVWRYPSAHSPKNRLGFYFPDDAFFVDHGSAIISNQEQNETIVKIAYPSGKIIWSYGHPGHAGSAPGYLHEPDDAYLLPNGQVTVADAYNCRILVINPNGSIAHQIGTTGVCVHNPPTSMGTPNGDTPLKDGNLLISEINGSWVSEYTMTGKLVWTTHLPISYPSDPQQLGPDRYLIADYTRPGAFLQFNRSGRVLYRYQPSSGPGMLNYPSLVERLPSGVFMANDDYNDRVVAIDPQTGALVWQYGITGKPGTAAGMLNTPDGFDVVGPNGSTPTHPATG